MSEIKEGYKRNCTCGEWSSPEIVNHRKDGPCFLIERKRDEMSEIDSGGPAEEEIKLKKVEKDFKELLEIANGMRSWCDVKEGWAMIWGMQFDAWKKARGIE